MFSDDVCVSSDVVCHGGGQRTGDWTALTMTELDTFVEKREVELPSSAQSNTVDRRECDLSFVVQKDQPRTKNELRVFYMRRQRAH